MKKIPSLSHPLLALLWIIWACSFSQPEDMQADVDAPTDSSRVLIVYVSRTNNTKAIAEIIHKNVGGTLVA